MSIRRKPPKLRHSSLDLDPDLKKKQDMLSRARCKLTDVLRPKKIDEKPLPKSMTQCTLDYLFKQKPDKLQKQISMGAYPEIQVSSCDNDDVFLPVSRNRPATVCVDRPSVDRRSEADALALERPRKKLSFKEPEVDHKIKRKTATSTILKNSDNGYNIGKGIQSIAGLGLSVVANGQDAESQAMRVVRTVGQAFEVCHKLSIGAPEDQDDEQDTTLTQDLLSDRLSDVASDKPKKDLMDDQQSDKNSLSPDEPPKEIESSIKKRLPHLDVLPPPPSKSNSPRKTSPMHAETYSSPHSDAFPCISQSGSATSTLPPPGSALSSHHEIQLLREQLEQQRQQTQAAVAQLQLTRDQLTSEQTARMEAQTRTHQLLVHNRELLDHIAALVAHLQGGDKSEPAHINMPQQPMDNDPAYLLHLPTPTLYENRNATSPLRPPLFNYSSPFLDTPNLERDMIQRLQGLNLYGGGLYNPYVNNYNPYQYNPYATIPRRYNLDHSRLNRHSEPRQMFPTYAPPHEEAYSMPAYTKPPPPKEEPMSHVGISPADEEGRARMTLPIGKGEERDRLGELRLMNGPGVARSASERVPNRSELMSQVQRTTWARHTTK